MKFNTHAIKSHLSDKNLINVISYFEINKARILKELESLKELIVLIPLLVVIREPEKTLQSNYQTIGFKKEK